MLYQGVRILGYMTVLLLLLVHTTCGDMCLLQMQVQLSYGCCWLDVLYVCVSVWLQALIGGFANFPTTTSQMVYY